MVGQPPWVRHDFKICWSPDDVAETVGAANGAISTTRGTGIKDDDNQQPAAIWCRTSKLRPATKGTGMVQTPRGKSNH